MVQDFCVVSRHRVAQVLQVHDEHQQEQYQEYSNCHDKVEPRFNNLVDLLTTCQIEAAKPINLIGNKHMPIILPNPRNLDFATPEILDHICKTQILIRTTMQHQLFLAKLWQHKGTLAARSMRCLAR